MQLEFTMTGIIGLISSKDGEGHALPII